jgi:hypothetical protein
MLNKPIGWKTLAVIAFVAISVYAFIATLVNIKLLETLLSVPLSPDTFETAARLANSCAMPWATAMVAICFITAVFSSGDGAVGAYVFASSGDENNESTIWSCTDAFATDDGVRINPANGMVMIGCTDALGNPYGSSNEH